MNSVKSGLSLPRYGLGGIDPGQFSFPFQNDRHAIVEASVGYSLIVMLTVVGALIEVQPEAGPIGS